MRSYLSAEISQNDLVLYRNLIGYGILSLYIIIIIGRQLLAAGDEVGTLHIMEIPWNLQHASNNEVKKERVYVKATYYENPTRI